MLIKLLIKIIHICHAGNTVDKNVFSASINKHFVCFRYADVCWQQVVDTVVGVVLMVFIMRAGMADTIANVVMMWAEVCLLCIHIIYTTHI